jgi:hypothetical protein
MFISNAEKNHIKTDIMSLHAEVKQLKEDLVLLRQSWAAQAGPLVKTAEAPWGYKKDGVPCKRPGRTPKAKVQP